jgi:hypothetical protein
MEKSLITVQSVDWLHEDTHSMIVAEIIIDDRRYEAAEYYDAINDRICTDADAYMAVHGLLDTRTKRMLKIFFPGQDTEEELFWTSVEEQIIAAMRAFVDADIKTQRSSVKTGSVVAFRKGTDVAWYDVVGTQGSFVITVREAGTNYSAQEADRSMIEQIRAA